LIITRGTPKTFDFAKNIGNKLFTSDAGAAKNITDHILSNNPEVENLSVIFKNGEATLIAESIPLKLRLISYRYFL